MFDLQQVEDYRIIPEVTSASLDLVLDAISESVDLSPYGHDLEVRMGAVWSRKGYPALGNISRIVDPAPSYRPASDEQVLITVSMLAPRHDWAMGPKLKTLIEQVEKAAVAAKLADEKKARQDKLDRAAALRAEADKLEAEVSDARP